MKESITKFDLEAAFKALDTIEIPVVYKIKANRPALNEIFSRKTKLESLMEEYYDVSDMGDLDDAKEAREAEVAKAKLARIEKIVDLDADSPEDLLTSYVGKYIIQCPQCMTLFYKNPEDVVEAEDDPETVNINEICQHCGNDAGYTLVGKVGEVAPEEADNFEATDELSLEEPAEEEPPVEETAEETGEPEDLGDLEELDLDLDLEDEEDTETTEESFLTHEGNILVEDLAEDSELDAKLEAHSEYIEYLRAAIAQEEKALEKATNEQVKVAIQRNIDAFKADLESALPEAVKNEMVATEVPTEEEATIEEEPVEETEVQEEAYSVNTGKQLTEGLQEEADLEVSAEEFDELINSSEFKKPISDAEVKTMLDAEEESEKPNKEDKVESLGVIMSQVDELQEADIETLISSSLVEAYGNVAGFRLNECVYANNKFTIDGTIYFTSGNTRKTTYTFNEGNTITDGKARLVGLNEKLGLDKQFTLTGKIAKNKTFIAESFTYTKK